MDKINTLETIEECFTLFKDGEVYRSVIDNTEKVLIEKALKRSGGNQIIAAKILGLNRNTLRTKIRKLNVNMEQFRL